MNISTPKRKTIGYWQMLLAGTLLSCLLMIAITLSYQRQLFGAWTSLSSPPSEVKRILAADASQVWVESRDGTFFTADITFYCRDSDICSEWEKITDIPNIPQQGFSRISINDCKSLWNPTARTYLLGRMAECVYARDTSRVLGDEGYFALMTSGDIFYWRTVRNPMTMPFFFILSFIVPFLVAMLVSAVYFIIWLLSRLRSAG